MQTEKFSVKRQIFVYIAGIMALSFGVYFVTSANLGVSPIISLPFVISKITGFSLGEMTFFINLICLLIQVAMLGKDFPRREVFQMAAAFIFSFLIDFISYFMAFIFFPSTVLQKILSFAVGLFFSGAGISFMSLSRLFMLPCDALSRVTAEKFNRDFGKTKVLVDGTILLTSTSLSLIFLRRLEGIHIGTFIIVVSVGNIISFFLHRLTKKTEEYIGF